MVSVRPMLQDVSALHEKIQLLQVHLASFPALLAQYFEIFEEVPGQPLVRRRLERGG